MPNIYDSLHLEIRIVAPQRDGYQGTFLLITIKAVQGNDSVIPVLFPKRPTINCS